LASWLTMSTMLPINFFQEKSENDWTTTIYINICSIGYLSMVLLYLKI
jgi:hypothetical protein